MKPKSLTQKEAAERLRVSPRTIYNWIKSDRIRAFKIANTVRIPSSEIERLENTGGAI